MQTNRDKIPWEGLLEAYRDAIILTLRLGIEYIWIDSLYIIQDDKNDWIKEAPRMGHVYSNTHVVFAVY